MSSDPSTWDTVWLNDRSEYQANFVHGLRNPIGLHLQYRVEGDRVVAEWTPGENHGGFPGFVHGGLVGAVLDDAMGRCPAMLHRWVMTARQTLRFRDGARIGEPLRVEAWMTQVRSRAIIAGSRMLKGGGAVVAESEATYLPVPPQLLESMVEYWPGFTEWVAAADE